MVWHYSVLVFTPFVVVVGGRYFLPTLECQFLNEVALLFICRLVTQIAQEYKCRTLTTFGICFYHELAVYNLSVREFFQIASGY